MVGRERIDIQLKVEIVFVEYLLRMALVKYSDPFATRNSIDVITFLKEQIDVGFLFSIDAEDLFYSVPQAELFESVRECIEFNGAISFQNSAGISVESFLSLLQ